MGLCGDRTASRARTRIWRVQMRVRWLRGQVKGSSKRLCGSCYWVWGEWRVLLVEREVVILYIWSET
jgi:hypothetical protein